MRRAWTLVGCVTVDLAAVGLVLSPDDERRTALFLAAIALHTAAVLAFHAASTSAPRCRRILGAAAVLAVPGAGALVAIAALWTPGRAEAPTLHRDESGPRHAHAADELRRLAEALSPFDALEWGDEAQRREALSSLARRSDREAALALRWATRRADPELATSAALALDELCSRGERRSGVPFRIVEVPRARA